MPLKVFGEVSQGNRNMNSKGPLGLLKSISFYNRQPHYIIPSINLSNSILRLVRFVFTFTSEKIIFAFTFQ